MRHWIVQRSADVVQRIIGDEWDSWHDSCSGDVQRHIVTSESDAARHMCIGWHRAVLG